MNIEKENKIYSGERERNYELREAGVDEELKKATAMEKADFLTKEIKTSKKQIQNIILNMQQVTNAIRQLRTQLQLAEDSSDPTSVIQDKKKIKELKNKIQDYVGEMEKMREDLIRGEMAELKKGAGINMSNKELKKQAEKNVEKMISEIKK